jgi:hypothetical protein
MEGRQDEKKGEPKSSYLHLVYNIFNIPWLLPRGSTNLSKSIILSFPMLVGFLIVLPTTCSH